MTDIAIKNPKPLLIVMLCGTFSAGICEGMMNIALDSVSELFGIPLSWANWVIVGFTVVAATSITCAAALLRRLSLRVVFAIASGAMLAGSVVCICYLNFPMLVIGRLITAVATGLMFPTATVVIMRLMPGKGQGTWLGADSGIIACGVAVGPVLSGWLLTYFGLRAMFALSAVLGALLLVLGYKFMRPIEKREDAPIDALSVGLSFFGLGSFMVGLGEVFRDPAVGGIAIAAGLAIIALFVKRQFKLEVPLLDLTPMKHRFYSLGIILITIAMMAEMSLAVLLPLYLEGTAGFTPFIAGALMCGPVACDFIFAIIGGKIDDRHGIWPLAPFGCAMIALGFVGVYFGSLLALTVAAALLSGITYAGIGFIVAPDKSAAIGSLPGKLQPYGASIESTLVQVGNSFGSALFVGVLSAQVLSGTHAGMTKAAAYAAAFQHTILIGLAIAVVSVIVAIYYAWNMRKRGK